MTEQLFLLLLWTIVVLSFLLVIGLAERGIEYLRRYLSERRAARAWDRARAGWKTHRPSYQTITPNQAIHGEHHV